MVGAVVEGLLVNVAGVVHCGIFICLLRCFCAEVVVTFELVFLLRARVCVFVCVCVCVYLCVFVCACARATLYMCPHAQTYASAFTC